MKKVIPLICYVLITFIRFILSNWKYWIFIIFLILYALISGTPLLLMEQAAMCGRSVQYAFISLIILFFGVYGFVNLMTYIQERWKYHQFLIQLLTISIFLVIIAINIFPMVFWIKHMQQAYLLPVYLILSNMLLYYYCFHTYREIQEEKHKVYVVSARLKGASQYNYLKEKRLWIMLNNLRPMFYHLFSFTLFTDTLVLNHDSSGIVGYMFLQLQNSNVTFTYELMLAIGVSFCILYPIKAILEYPEHWFTSNHDIETR